MRQSATFINYYDNVALVMTMSDNDHQKICARLRPAVVEDLTFLLDRGYSKTEIANEGVRLFAQKKRQEVPA